MSVRRLTERAGSGSDSLVHPVRKRPHLVHELVLEWDEEYQDQHQRHSHRDRPCNLTPNAEVPVSKALGNRGEITRGQGHAQNTRGFLYRRQSSIFAQLHSRALCVSRNFSDGVGSGVRIRWRSTGATRSFSARLLSFRRPTMVSSCEFEVTTVAEGEQLGQGGYR